jgi:hypothetical protein
VSDISDDFPLTPSTPAFPPSESLFTSDNKENMPTIFEPILNKQKIENPPDQYLPHDFVTFGRPALHALNVSPRVLAS